MNSDIQAALIAAIVALLTSAVAAVVSIGIAVYQSRKSSEAEIALENLKAKWNEQLELYKTKVNQDVESNRQHTAKDFELFKSRLAFDESFFKESIGNLQEIILKMQLIKDQAGRILSTFEDGRAHKLDYREENKGASERSKELSHLYGETISKFTPYERAVVHRAKDVGLYMSDEIKDLMIGDSKDADAIQRQLKAVEKLRNLRFEFNDLQQQLRDSISKRIVTFKSGDQTITVHDHNQQSP